MTDFHTGSFAYTNMHLRKKRRLINVKNPPSLTTKPLHMSSEPSERMKLVVEEVSKSLAMIPTSPYARSKPLSRPSTQYQQMSQRVLSCQQKLLTNVHYKQHIEASGAYSITSMTTTPRTIKN